MKNITKLLKLSLVFACVSLLSFEGIAQTYCTSAATVQNWSKIMNVKLAGNSTTIDQASTSCGGYENFTSVSPAELSAGGTYTVEVFKSNCTNLYRPV